MEWIWGLTPVETAKSGGAARKVGRNENKVRTYTVRSGVQYLYTLSMHRMYTNEYYRDVIWSDISLLQTIQCTRRERTFIKVAT